jgi:Domain of unknown function (DUF4157)
LLRLWPKKPTQCATGPRGRGNRPSTQRGLSAGEKALLRPYVADVDLNSAALHEGHVPWYLHPRFAAIVRGNHIYVRSGVYDPATVDGIALLGHELTHVAQYRAGMTTFKYLCSALRGYRTNKYEKAAFAVQALILRELAGDRTGSCSGTVRSEHSPGRPIPR